MDIQNVSDEKNSFLTPKSVETFFTGLVSFSFSIRTLPNPGGYFGARIIFLILAHPLYKM